MSNDLATSSVFLHSALPAVLIDHTGAVVAQNHASRDVFDPAVDDWTDVFDPADRPAVTELVGNVLAGREPRESYDARIRTSTAERSALGSGPRPSSTITGTSVM